MNFRHYIDLVESLLLENFAPLSKGSQFVFNNKDLVQKLANAVRLDIQSNPVSFPADFIKKVKGTKPTFTPPPKKAVDAPITVKVANTQAEPVSRILIAIVVNNLCFFWNLTKFYINKAKFW